MKVYHTFEVGKKAVTNFDIITVELWSSCAFGKYLSSIWLKHQDFMVIYKPYLFSFFYFSCYSLLWIYLSVVEMCSYA